MATQIDWSYSAYGWFNESDVDDLEILLKRVLGWANYPLVTAAAYEIAKFSAQQAAKARTATSQFFAERDEKSQMARDRFLSQRGDALANDPSRNAFQNSLDTTEQFMEDTEQILRRNDLPNDEEKAFLKSKNPLLYFSLFPEKNSH